MAHGGILREVAPLGGATMKVERMFRWSGQALGLVTWISSGLFGIYMLVFYAGSLAAGHAARWNQVLPGLYSESGRVSTAGMGMHFAAGGVILALGFIQLLGAVRARTPALHRWLGRIYVAAGAVAGIGGLLFIAFTGTIGGRVMDVGFGVYGVLMLVAAAQTYRYARMRETALHRAWALRLFALAIGSWLYRMEYGLWFMATHRLGHTGDFRGLFDVIMAFFFYLPNLLVVELYLRGGSRRAGFGLKLAAASVMAMATCMLMLATYFFATMYWWPAMMGRPA